MDLKTLNEKIAVELFSLKPHEDFGVMEDHEWERDRFGSINAFAFESNDHHGYRCTRCDYTYCVSCYHGPTEPCNVEVPDYTQEDTFWKVLNKLKEKYIVELEIDGDHVTCKLSKEDPANEDRLIATIAVEAESIPLAVCLAAVKSLELSVLTISMNVQMGRSFVASLYRDGRYIGTVNTTTPIIVIKLIKSEQTDEKILEIRKYVKGLHPHFRSFDIIIATIEEPR